MLDPQIEVRPIEGQIDDLITEIRKRVEKKQRVLVTTLTKRMAEDLAELDSAVRGGMKRVRKSRKLPFSFLKHVGLSF